MTRSAAPDLSGPPDVTGLLELARNRRLDLKPVVLRVQTDLFVAAAARDRASVEAYKALALGLLPVVDAQTLAVVAEKLAPVPEAPDSVLAALAASGGAARDAVVRHAQHLSPDLLAAAQSDGADLAPLVAARAGLGSGSLGALADRDDPAVDLALAQNPAIVLGGTALDRLVVRARARPELAVALLARADLGGAEIAPLYLAADPSTRGRIRSGVAALATLRPSPLPDIAENDPGPLLTALAARGDVAEFGAALCEALRLPPCDWSFAEPGRRDLLALALRAAGVPGEDAIFAFLTLEPEIARSVEAVHGLAALFRATRRGTALDLLASILDAPLGRAEPRREEASVYTPAARPRLDRAAIERAAPRPVKLERLRRTS